MSNKTPEIKKQPVYGTSAPCSPPATAGGLGQPTATTGRDCPRPGLQGGMPKK